MVPGFLRFFLTCPPSPLWYGYSLPFIYPSSTQCHVCSRLAWLGFWMWTARTEETHGGSSLRVHLVSCSNPTESTTDRAPGPPHSISDWIPGSCSWHSQTTWLHSPGDSHWLLLFSLTGINTTQLLWLLVVCPYLLAYRDGHRDAFSLNCVA